MKAEFYFENRDSLFVEITQSPFYYYTFTSNIVKVANLLKIDDIFDIDAFNNAIHNDMLLNRTCSTKNGDYEIVPSHLVYLYFLDIKEVYNMFKNTVNLDCLLKKVLFKCCSTNHIRFVFENYSGLYISDKNIRTDDWILDHIMRSSDINCLDIVRNYKLNIAKNI